MIEYLTAKPLALPRSISQAQAPKHGEGTLSSNLPAGELFLENRKRETFRLSWIQGEPEEGRQRSLPAGKYRLRTYRVERELDGQLWHTSATAKNIGLVTVVAGENTRLEIDQKIKLEANVFHGKAQMVIKGQKGAGLSIYRDSTRLPIDYRLMGASGEQLASGSMNYG